MKYIPSIGIEAHVQLNTKTKLFSGVSNDARTAKPNHLISHIDVGMPGALPVLNEQALRLAVLAGLAINGQPQKHSRFDRKHYFYPDLPKGYQISQYEQPLIVGGHVHIDVDGERICVGITRAHLEEDAGKNTHPPGADYSLVDLNRAGTPLLEIVSQPDIHSPAEAKSYARELYLLMKYSGVSDCDMYHGNLRFDVNVSLSNSKGILGTRTEVKNLNSFRSVEGAVSYEIKRQQEVLASQDVVVQETRGWDEAKQKTTTQRGKEESQDYRYMPEPDIPPLQLTEEYIARVKQELPQLPNEIRGQLAGLSLDQAVIEDLLDRPMALDHTLQILISSCPEDARRTAFWFIHAEPTFSDDPDFTEPKIKTVDLVAFSKMIAEGKLSSSAAKAVFTEMLKSGRSPDAVAKQLDFHQMTDQKELAKIVAKVIADNPQAVSDLKAGAGKIMGFLVGQVMATSSGRANPKLTTDEINRQLDL